jgi:RNA polymerase sigma-70 factor (ECF subfamily)
MPNTPRQTAPFIELLNAHQNRLYGYLYSLVLNFDDAEDLYQEVATLLWKKFDQYEPNSDFGRWGIRIAHLTVKNFIRRRRRSRIMYSDEVLDQVMESQSVVATPAMIQRTEALALCMERLTESDRELVESCYSGEMKIRDVARRDGRSPDAIYAALYRIRKSLFKCIELRVRREVSL